MRWLIIAWDPVDRAWVPVYTKAESPPCYNFGLEYEVFRVNLAEDLANSAGHVFLEEEP
jgi:hypothetical protein